MGESLLLVGALRDIVLVFASRLINRGLGAIFGILSWSLVNALLLIICEPNLGKKEAKLGYKLLVRVPAEVGSFGFADTILLTSLLC